MSCCLGTFFEKAGRIEAVFGVCERKRVEVSGADALFYVQCVKVKELFCGGDGALECEIGKDRANEDEY